MGPLPLDAVLSLAKDGISNSLKSRVPRRAKRRPLLAALAALAALLLLADPLRALACAITGAQAYQPQLNEAISAFHRAGTGTLGSNYPPLPQIEKGYPSQTLVPGSVPCVILKAVGYVESHWRQARNTPRGQTGEALVSYGCGYGVMQITSGMRNPGDLPPDVQQRIATEYIYNIGYGAKMLVDKWNYGPYWVPAIGSRDPTLVEDWYYTVWAYNTWGWRNNPNNPAYPWPRPAFDGTQNWLDYPYQELIYGLAAHPPSENGQALWSPVAATLPSRDVVGLNPGWIATPSPSHTSPCATLNVAPASLLILADPGAVSLSDSLRLDGGGASFSWQARGSAPWILLYPTSGSGLPVTIRVRAAAPPILGTYTGTITIEAGGQRKVVPVTLRVARTQKLYLPIVTRNFNLPGPWKADSIPGAE